MAFLASLLRCMLSKRLSDRMGFPGGSMVRSPPAHARDAGNLGSISWRRKWQPTPVLLPGKFHGQRSLAGCNLWSHKERDTTEPTRRLGQSSFPINTVELNAENTAAPTGGNRRPLQWKCPVPTTGRPGSSLLGTDSIPTLCDLCLQGNKSGRGNEESRVCSRTLQSNKGERRVWVSEGCVCVCVSLSEGRVCVCVFCLVTLKSGKQKEAWPIRRLECSPLGLDDSA